MIPAQQRTGEVANGQHAADFYRSGDEAVLPTLFSL